MIRKLSPLLLSFLLISGYLFLNKKAFYSLVQRKIIPPNVFLYRSEQEAWEREAWDKYNQYWAFNVFDKGFTRILESEFTEGLTIHPEDTPLRACKEQDANGNFIISYNSSKNIVKVPLPKGFRDGILRLYNQAASEYSIGISYDLDNWGFSRYPGYSERLMNIVSLKKEASTNEAVYVKFIPESNEALSVCLSEFQYVSNLPNEIIDYTGHPLFAPDIEVDYDGEIIYQPGVSYEEYQSKKNL